MNVCWIATALLAMGACVQAVGEPEFVSLGEPVRIREMGPQFVTSHPDGYHQMWGNYQGVDGIALIGIRTDTGETTRVSLDQFGRAKLQMAKGPDETVFAYAGNPGHFLKYDPATAELTDLGIPVSPATYWMSTGTSPDGRWYVGPYPTASLASVDLSTGEITNHGRLPEDEKQKYITTIAISDDNIAYASVGLHHQELWSYNPATDEKRQILPEELTAAQGAPKVWIGSDGQVYGRAQGVTFLCKPDGIERDKSMGARVDPERHVAGDVRVVGVNGDGRLKLVNAETEEESWVQTDYPGRPIQIYSIGDERDGKLYGGTLFPGIAFSIDTQSGELADLGRLAPGAIQIYDIISHELGLFLGSYMGCKLDFYDPGQPAEQGVNPKHITGSIKGHERPNQWELGPDGMLYFGTTPAKGRLGGALVRLNPETHEYDVWDQIVPNQSLTYLTSLNEEGLLFGCCTVGGGSSAIPTETEAQCFLWDCAAEEVVWTGQPVPATRTYLRAVRAPDGLVYGLAGTSHYYAFDPATRETVFTAELPVERIRFPYLNDEPVGERGLIVGLGDDVVFAIDPTDQSFQVLAQHASIAKAHGFKVTADGVLYYGSGEQLWRAGEEHRRWRVEYVAGSDRHGKDNQMIIDRPQNACLYASTHPGFAAALELVRDFDFANAESGPAEIDGERLTINVIRGEGKAIEDCKLEAHKKYIDIQYLVSGDEQFGWMLTEDCTEPIGEFDDAKDVIKYDDAPEGWFPLLPGTFAIFFPEDAHAPMMGEGPIEKLVVKVLVEW